MKTVSKRLLGVLVVFCALLLVSGVYAGNTDTININTASAKELTKLERVGKKYAERIIEYRETNGPFEKPEDIMKVKGIGRKTWEANKDRIVVDDAAGSQ